MELFAMLAACAALSSGAPVHVSSVSVSECEAATVQYQTTLKAAELSEDDRIAIARVAFAEAGNQGDSGLAAVVYTIINRLISGQFADSVSAVVNAPHQFEPVHKAGGWQQLPALSPAQKSRVNTIINLALAGHLPDLTNGALFFQNPDVVADREAVGSVSEGLTHFGGSIPSAVIEDHFFYASINGGYKGERSNPTSLRVEAIRQPEAEAWDTYRKAQEQALSQSQPWDVFAPENADKSVFVGMEQGR